MGWSLSDIGNAVSSRAQAARDALSHGVDTVASTATSAARSVTTAVTRTASTVASTARDLGTAARDRAVDLGRAGMDLGRRGVEVARNFDVREAAATARQGISTATEAARDGITTATEWSSARVGDVSDYARSHVNGDDLASRAFRGVVTGAESMTRFQLGVTGGITREIASTVGAVGQLAVTATEMQVSAEARLEYGTAIVNGVADAGRATGGYLESVVDDPSRLASDVQGAWDATSGFVGDTASRYGQAIREGRTEEIGMDVGTVATYVVPVGGGPARGALTAAVRTGVREGGEVAARSTAAALTRGGGEAVVRTTVREGGEAGVRATAETALRTGPALAERNGAALLQKITAADGTAPLPQGAGRIADVAAVSRLSGREVAVYRDGVTGTRQITLGNADSVTVPAGSRIVAHTQPGVGTAALAPSAADLTGLARLGQRGSAIIDDAGNIARFRVDDAAAQATRAVPGEVVRFEAPRSVSSASPTTPPALLPAEGNVGTYRDLVAAGSRGDNITPHHIPSANRMKAEGVSKNDGVAINMEHPSPGVGGRHRATFTYGSQADLAMTPRQALAAGVLDARRIYIAQGLYTPEIRQSLLDVIRLNKELHPQIFGN